MNKKILLLAAVGVTGLSSSLIAGPIPYPTPGVENPVTYSFTATASGDVMGYFAGSGAAYDEVVGMSVNGAPVASFGLDDHSSLVGDSFNFGSVTAGDTLVFVLNTLSPPLGLAYSDPSLNGPYDGLGAGPGHNHVYSTGATAGQVYAGSPAGTYVAFEDLPFYSPPDWNYFDDTFIFTDVSTTTSVPDSGSTMMLLGMAMTGLGLLRRKA
jgi:VPDSG-CTERM motif